MTLAPVVEGKTGTELKKNLTYCTMTSIFNLLASTSTATSSASSSSTAGQQQLDNNEHAGSGSSGGGSSKSEEGMAVAPLAAVLIEAALKLCSLGDLNVLILVDEASPDSESSSSSSDGRGNGFDKIPAKKARTSDSAESFCRYVNVCYMGGPERNGQFPCATLMLENPVESRQIAADVIKAEIAKIFGVFNGKKLEFY